MKTKSITWERITANTYNIQVVEQQSHSFAFGFPPEGDFAPKAHYIAVPKQSYHARDKKVVETQRSGFQTAQTTRSCK